MNDGVMLLATILAAWRVTHLIVAEDGPWNLVARLRRRAGVGAWGDLMDCFYCTSLWVAAPLALGLGVSLGLSLSDGWFTCAVLWLAISGGAIVIDRALPEPPEGDGS